MKLLEKIQQSLREALKNKDAVRLDTLRLVVGETQRSHDSAIVDDNYVVKVIRKIMEGNDEVLRVATEKKVPIPSTIKAQNVILSEFLPKQLSLDELKAYFVGEIMLQIMAAGSLPQAIGLAHKHLKSQNLSYDGKMVNIIVEELRT